MSEKKKGIWKYIPDGIPCLVIVFGLFTFIGMQMGVPQMLNTIMKTAHDLLLNTCFYLMAICVITGAIGKIFVEFGVVKLLERLLRPLMRPLFNLPGVASLGAVMTFLSDNPAIISLSRDKKFSSYFKKYQYISLTNFGTAFGMGLLVIVFMVGQGFYAEPFIGLFGAFVGCIFGAFFIFVQDPLLAVGFVIMFLILQQIENNMIYPRVVGTSIGLPGMWVLVAVTIGGELMGIAGMLIMIPISSVLYTLLREFTSKRVAERQIDPEKLRDHPPELKSKFKENRERKKEQRLLKQMKELAAKHAEKHPKKEN